MRAPHPAVLGVMYGLSEIALGMARRSGRRAQSRDRHSLAFLWIAILLGIALSVTVADVYPGAAMSHRRAFYLVGLVLFVLGLILRWYAIIVLGKFFTVDVAIAKEHRVVDSGPYRWVRHPSYTGALLAFLGFGFCLGNWLSILCLMIPITAAFLWRIRIEERALLEALGQDYATYMGRTKRLLPFLY